MRKILAGLAFTLAAMTSPQVRATPADEVRAVYGRFLAGRSRDLQQVRSVLWNSPTFLWVSDGMSVWGVDALVERMGQFQQAEIWHVEPDLAKAVPVELSATTAYLHLPLVLTIGSSAKPDLLRFLVSVLGVQTPGGLAHRGFVHDDGEAEIGPSTGFRCDHSCAGRLGRVPRRQEGRTCNGTRTGAKLRWLQPCC